MKNGVFIGIDFGTTNTAVVCLMVNEYGEKVLYLGEGGEEKPFSSIVAIPKEQGAMLFGNEVKKHRLELAKDYEIISSMKSWLGIERCLINNKYSATEITKAFLMYIKDHIKEHYDIAINEAVFAFPVDFTHEARTALSQAAEEAGIHIKGFVSESTAAYIASKNDAKAYSKVMVIDWGGGTLDISILDLKGSQVYENSVYGEKLGGDDIDNELAHRIHSKLVNKTKIKVNFDDMTTSQKDNIITVCENMKIEFGFDQEDQGIIVRNYGEFGTKSLEIDYEYFKEIVSPIIKNRVIKTINTAMERAQTSKEGIDAIILVGGSCGLRPFAEVITNIFGEEKIIIPDKVQWSVAVGAALMDVIGSEYYLNEDIGVLLSDNTVYPILQKGKDKVGSVVGPITFALTEDAPDAHFIFTNRENTINYGIKSIPTKGFLKEMIELSASIEHDQIARIKIINHNMGENGKRVHEVNKLKFYYDLAKIKRL